MICSINYMKANLNNWFKDYGIRCSSSKNSIKFSKPYRHRLTIWWKRICKLLYKIKICFKCQVYLVISRYPKVKSYFNCLKKEVNYSKNMLIWCKFIPLIQINFLWLVVCPNLMTSNSELIMTLKKIHLLKVELKRQRLM